MEERNVRKSTSESIVKVILMDCRWGERYCVTMQTENIVIQRTRKDIKKTKFNCTEIRRIRDSDTF